MEYNQIIEKLIDFISSNGPFRIAFCKWAGISEGALWKALRNRE